MLFVHVVTCLATLIRLFGCRYSDQSGQLSCKACPHGKWATTAGSKQCNDPSHFWVHALCPAGEVAHDYKAEALFKAHKQPSEDGGVQSVSCIACPPGTYKAAKGAGFCRFCPLGYSSQPGQTSCSSPAPSQTPTQHPTSGAPTAKPSQFPTAVPTYDPSPAPSTQPTIPYGEAVAISIADKMEFECAAGFGRDLFLVPAKCVQCMPVFRSCP